LTSPSRCDSATKLEGYDDDWRARSALGSCVHKLPPQGYRCSAVDRLLITRASGTRAVPLWTSASAPPGIRLTEVRIVCVVSAVFIVWLSNRLRCCRFREPSCARFDERLQNALAWRGTCTTLSSRPSKAANGCRCALDLSADPIRMRGHGTAYPSARTSHAEGRAALIPRTGDDADQHLVEALRRVTRGLPDPKFEGGTFFLCSCDCQGDDPIGRDEISPHRLRTIRTHVHSGIRLK